MVRFIPFGYLECAQEPQLDAGPTGRMRPVVRDARPAAEAAPLHGRHRALVESGVIVPA